MEKLKSSVYEELAAHLEADASLRPGEFDFTDKTLDFCRFQPEARLLDIGCGTGATVGHLIRSDKVVACGIDLSDGLLDRGRMEFGYLPLIRGDGTCLPFAAATFDGVFAECTLSVIGNYDAVIGECRRVLKKNGYLILSDIYRRNAGSSLDQCGAHPDNGPSKILSQEQLRRILELHGFVLRFWEDQSTALKSFAAKIIFAGGSIETLWNALCGSEGAESGAATIGNMTCRKTVGYFSLIAQKAE